jgi:peptidyl-prolyl cis-trans isomerase A (cyclophilin A)
MLPSKTPNGNTKESDMTFRSSLPATAVTLTLLMAFAVAMNGQATRGKAALMKPADLKEQAPATFKANFDTSAGPFVIEVHREWAPNGADRFYNLVKRGFYDDVRFFRVIPGFMAQFGINGDPSIMAVWRGATIPPDPVKQSNKKGFVTYAMGASPDTRTTQLFINLVDNTRLDASGFAPFGQVSSGMNVVEKLFGEYGEGAPRGKGPDQGSVQMQGNKYLEKEFPKLDFVKTATVAP